MVKLVAGNWKMNGCLDDISLVQTVANAADKLIDKIDVVLCVPAVFVQNFVQKKALYIGGQNCHYLKTGAYTGEISADMLRNVGANYVIVGHSERRVDCYETDKIVHAKANAAFAARLEPIICVGETHEQYTQAISAKIVAEQIKNSVPKTDKPFAIGYEPIWAIGTGLIPHLDEIANIHQVIRDTLQTLLGKQSASKVRILYGGSVKPSNAYDIAKIPNVDGALVGGASLNADDFIQIMTAFADYKPE
jgi:triosephosphate isomerase